MITKRQTIENETDVVWHCREVLNEGPGNVVRRAVSAELRKAESNIKLLTGKRVSQKARAS